MEESFESTRTAPGASNAAGGPEPPTTLPSQPRSLAEHCHELAHLAELGRQIGPKDNWVTSFIDSMGLFEDRPAIAEDAVDLRWILDDNVDSVRDEWEM
jgi:hypothetical protein